MKRWYWLVPSLLALVVYAAAPWGGLVWDDPFILDRQLVAFKTITDVFFPPDGIFHWSENYYRPIVILSYMLDTSLYGSARVAGMHSSNVIFHVVTTFFVWLLARRLLRHLPNGAVGAVLAASIFAVHPIHSESVNWIAGRSDVLATMFFVPGVIMTLLWRDSGAKWTLALAAILYMLALLSKEVAIAALIVVPAALFLTPPLSGLQRNATMTDVDPKAEPEPQSSSDFRSHTTIGIWLTTAIVYFGVTGLYLMLRFTDGVAYGKSLDIPWLEYILRLERSFAYYLSKVFVPWPQSNHVAWDLTPGAIATNAAFLAALGLLAFAIWLWRHRRDGSLLFAVLWFGATLAPSILVAVRFISGIPLAERYLYLPSAGIALALGYICCQPYIGKWFRPATWAAVFLIMVYSVATIERGIVWSSNILLWSDATEKAPSHGDSWNQLGIAYFQQGDYERAMDAFEQAIITINSVSGKSYAKRNIALIYIKKNDLQRAKEYFIDALDIFANNPEAHYGLGTLYVVEANNMRKEGGRKRQISTSLSLAADHLESAILLNPFHTEARWALASVFALQGQDAEADGQSQQAVVRYQSARAEIDALTIQDPAFGSRMEVRSARVVLIAALKRLAK